jgi:biopolymer transport protein ExbD
MAIRIRRKRRKPEEIPLASTADIAFLLIVFYLATSSLIEMKGVTIPLPKPDAPPMQVLKKSIFRLSVDKQGSYLHEKTLYDPRSLLQRLIQGREANPEIIVVLSVSPSAPSDSVPRVVQIIREAGIEKFSMKMGE